MTYFLASEPILPFNHTETAIELQESFDLLKVYLTTSINSSQLALYNLKDFQNWINNFKESVITLNEYVYSLNSTKYSLNETLPTEVLIINLKLFFLERIFLNKSGLPMRPWYQHLLQAPGFFLGYGSQRFPGKKNNLLIEFDAHNISCF